MFVRGPWFVVCGPWSVVCRPSFPQRKIFEVHRTKARTFRFKVAVLGLKPVPNHGKLPRVFDRQAEMSVRVLKRLPVIDVR